MNDGLELSPVIGHSEEFVSMLALESTEKQFMALVQMQNQLYISSAKHN